MDTTERQQRLVEEQAARDAEIERWNAETAVVVAAKKERRRQAEAAYEAEREIFEQAAIARLGLDAGTAWATKARYVEIATLTPVGVPGETDWRHWIEVQHTWQNLAVNRRRAEQDQS